MMVMMCSYVFIGNWNYSVNLFYIVRFNVKIFNMINSVVWRKNIGMFFGWMKGKVKCFV